MNFFLIAAIAVALLGFVLLLEPKVLWKLVQKEKALSTGMAALLRLIGIGVLLLSVLLAERV